MISDFGFVFVIIPCIAAVIAGAVLYDWRLAAAAACGAFALLFVAPLLPDAARLFGTSFISGVAVGALALVAHLLWRPTVGIWSRMTSAMMAAFAVHFALLVLTVGRV